MSINGNKLNAVYRDCIEQLCEHFFPQGKKIGADWAIGDSSGAPGKSLRINLVTSERTTAGVWHDQATGEGGTFAQLIQAHLGVTFREAATLIGNVVGVDLEEVAANGTYGAEPRRPAPQAQPARGSAPFDWSGPEFEGLSEGRKEMLSQWRGYSPEFVEWLSSEHLIKIYQGNNWAFPVAMPGIGIRGAHYRSMTSGEHVSWEFVPTVKEGGPGVHPFVIGNLDAANQINGQIHIFESQWDMLAACDKLSIHQTDGYAAFCTRGAGNHKLAATLPKVPKLYAWMQNDGAGEKWFEGIVQAVQRPVRRIEVPEGYNDLNDWIRDGYAGSEELFEAVKVARLVEPEVKEDPPLNRKLNEEQNKKSEPRQLDGVNILAFARLPIDKQATLLGDRYLCRRAGMFIVAPSGQGKSTLSVQLAVEWALGRHPLGIQANGKLRVLIIQAEDDNGDVTEMSRWILNNKFSEQDLSIIERNTHIELVDDCTGAKFAKALDEICELWKPDIVIANPYESYLGSDPKDTDKTNDFLRHNINPVVKRHRCGLIFMHHTPKTQYSKTEDFTTSDFMYRGSGCAAMTNWARAYMVFEPVNDEGLFRFVAAKRGKRIGWDKMYRYFKHSQTPGILKWEEADEEGRVSEDLRTAKKSGNPSKPIEYSKVLECVPDDPQEKNEVESIVRETCKLSRDKMRQALTYLKSQGLIFERTIPNPKSGKRGSRGIAAWAKKPDPDFCGCDDRFSQSQGALKRCN